MTELHDLRIRVTESYGWRKDGESLTDEQVEALSETQRKEVKWQADPALVDELIVLEEETTMETVIRGLGPRPEGLTVTDEMIARLAKKAEEGLIDLRDRT